MERIIVAIVLPGMFKKHLVGKVNNNKTKRSYTQLDSRKQVIALWNRVTTIHKGSSTPTEMREVNRRQTSTMLKISTKSMY